ncbi:MAG: 5'/3'-nucleotidase SurE [Chlamydiia bacterium]|nr:5'/3'-nucleotidase SurE [Chlamydiia bacterium]
MNKPLLLLINDDGIEAEGLLQLYLSLRDEYRLAIVAPEREQSGVGLAITLHTPLQLTPSKLYPEGVAWRVNGTPADCVKLALNIVLDETPAAILSGINRGSNAGRNVLYSGTIGGVIEGVLRGIQGMALSCSIANGFFPDAFGDQIRHLVRDLLEDPLPEGSLLNVNFPATRNPLGIRFAQQGKSYWLENLDQRQHPREEKPYYWLGGRLSEYEESPESDVALLDADYTTATPLQVSDLTDHAQFMRRVERMNACLNSLHKTIHV